jgi:hypothetical protein
MQFYSHFKPTRHIVDMVDQQRRAVMIASLVFAGMILVASVGVFGAYALGFNDGVKDSDTRRLLEAYRNEAEAWHELNKETRKPLRTTGTDERRVIIKIKSGPKPLPDVTHSPDADGVAPPRAL